MTSLWDNINESNFRCWGFKADECTKHYCENGSGVLFGAPPVVQNPPSVFSATTDCCCCLPTGFSPDESKGNRILHVSSDNLGYPGWIISGLIEAVTAVLSIGNNHEYPVGWEKYLKKIRQVKSMLYEKNLPLFSITPDVIAETAEILEFILQLVRPEYSLEGVKVQIIGAGFAGIICAFLIKKLYNVDKIIVYEKRGNIGGRFQSNFSGAMRFPKDSCLEILLQWFEEQAIQVNQFELEPVTQKTLLYNPDSKSKFEWFLESNTFHNYDLLIDGIADRFDKFRKNFGISECSDFDSVNSRYCAIFELETFRNWTFGQFLRSDSSNLSYRIPGANHKHKYNGISEKDFQLFSHLGFYTGNGLALSEKRLSSMVPLLEDGRFQVQHIAMPNLLEVMHKYLLSNGVVFELNTHIDSSIEVPMNQLVIDTRPRRYMFHSTSTLNQERWEPFNGAKLFFNMKDMNDKLDKTFSVIKACGVDRIIGLNTNCCKDNIYFVKGWIVNYCWFPWYASTFITQYRRLNEKQTPSTSQFLEEVSKKMEKHGSEIANIEYRTVQSDKLQPKMMSENLEEVLDDLRVFLKPLEIALKSKSLTLPDFFTSSSRMSLKRFHTSVSSII